MTTVRIYHSFCQWPISVQRLDGGWLVRFFALTILVDRPSRARE